MADDRRFFDRSDPEALVQARLFEHREEPPRRRRRRRLRVPVVTPLLVGSTAILVAIAALTAVRFLGDRSAASPQRVETVADVTSSPDPRPSADVPAPSPPAPVALVAQPLAPRATFAPAPVKKRPAKPRAAAVPSAPVQAVEPPAAAPPPQHRPPSNQVGPNPPVDPRHPVDPDE